MEMQHKHGRLVFNLLANNLENGSFPKNNELKSIAWKIADLIYEERAIESSGFKIKQINNFLHRVEILDLDESPIYIYEIYENSNSWSYSVVK